MRRIALFVLLGFAASAGAQEFVVSVLPTLEIPLGSSGDLYDAGGGVDLAAVYAPADSTGLRFSGAVGYRALPSLADASLSLVSLAAGAGYQYALNPRLLLFSDARAGGYFGSYDGSSAFDLMATIEGGAVFALAPAFRLGLSTSLAGYFANPEPLLTGLGLRIAGTFTPGVRGGLHRPRLQIMDPRLEAVFPVFFKWYDSNAAGSIVILNKENRPIRNVRASIFVKEFMDAPKVFAEIPEIAKGESREVPVLALYTDRLLSVTESTKVAAEITVSYELPDGTLQVSHTETLRVLDRNAMTWADDRRVASFVTPKDPALLGLAKNVAGAVREDSAVAADLNFRVAMAMYQALALYGMSYVVDPKSSYADLSKQEQAIDYLQFPRQTLKYRSGDCDDLSILFNSLLEAVGIETAFVTVPGHIFSAVALSMSPEEATRGLTQAERLIVQDGVVYLPIEATMFSKGFNAAWIEGARQWREAGKDAKLTPVREAWKTYEAVGLREADPDFSFPGARAVLASYRGELDRFVDEELGVRLAALQEEIKRNGATPANQNRLGILYARYGKYAEAESALQRILRQDEYLPALVNLANISYLKGDAAAAASWYERALQKDPRNRVALAGAAKARSDLGQAAAASVLVGRLKAIDPASAESLAALEPTASPEARAAAAADKRVTWSE